MKGTSEVHVPYRQSSLTTVLKPYLQEPLDTNWVAICCLKYMDQTKVETQNWLKFAMLFERGVIGREQSYHGKVMASEAAPQEAHMGLASRPGLYDDAANLDAD